MQSPRLLGTSQTAPARATDRRVSNPKLESIRVSGDTNRRQAPLISGQAEALPYASPACRVQISGRAAELVESSDALLRSYRR